MNVYEKGFYNVQRNDVTFYPSRITEQRRRCKERTEAYTSHERYGQTVLRDIRSSRGVIHFYNVNLTGHISDYICDVSPAYDDSERPNASVEKISAGNLAKTDQIRYSEVYRRSYQVLRSAVFRMRLLF
jgi:hypothetical protein